MIRQQGIDNGALVVSPDSVWYARVFKLLSSGTRIFGIYHIYTWYIPCICRPLTYTWNILGISMDIPCISTEMDIPCMSTQYIHGISMDIHGISIDGYTWYIRGISMDIPGYS
jgi:hypothetical protein